MSDIVVRRVEDSDGALLKRIRLRALVTDPASFGSTYEREAAFPDETWAGRAARSAAGDDAMTLLAMRGDESVGLFTAIRDGSQRELFHGVEMFVAPEARRRGIARRLLSDIEGWIAACGGTIVRLSVTSTATAARQLYESAGYAPDGSSAGSRHTSGLIEISLRKELGT
ncbi:MAG: GNAT family N-acetyltransferase [Dehalococcoidia bacterium]